MTDTELAAWVKHQHDLYKIYRTQVPTLGWRPDKTFLFGVKDFNSLQKPVFEALYKEGVITPIQVRIKQWDTNFFTPPRTIQLPLI